MLGRKEKKWRDGGLRMKLNEMCKERYVTVSERARGSTSTLCASHLSSE